jgi:peptidoglycan-associated lipoprotein
VRFQPADNRVACEAPQYPSLTNFLHPRLTKALLEVCQVQHGGRGVDGMPQILSFNRCARFVAVLGAVLALAACANRPGAETTQSLTIGGPGAARPGSSQDFVINVGDRVFFETDSTQLTPTAIATLNKQVLWLQQYSRYTFIIEGHADERGTREYNIALGARRASTVREYFMAHGIPAARMRTISYGKERPVAVCNDISCWSQNRRAVIVLSNAGV